MKKTLCALVLMGAAASAHAVPIDFAFDGGSLSATGGLALGYYSANSGSASLDDGDSQNFNFGTVGLIGGGSGDLAVTVDFVAPTSSGVDVSGPYSVVALLFYNDGEWSGGSTEFDYNYGGYAGSALLTLDAIDETFIGLPTFDFTGSIENLGSVAVPEPATLSLLGVGLLGFGLARRRSRRPV